MNYMSEEEKARKEVVLVVGALVFIVGLMLCIGLSLALFMAL